MNLLLEELCDCEVSRESCKFFVGAEALGEKGSDFRFDYYYYYCRFYGRVSGIPCFHTPRVGRVPQIQIAARTSQAVRDGRRYISQPDGHYIHNQANLLIYYASALTTQDTSSHFLLRPCTPRSRQWGLLRQDFYYRMPLLT